ncbi:ribonuclease D protein [Corynebacterium humireducens NBRC 106098 = DSM 45392]|uniref:Ribonuclease D protein n=1 Tax=Corynebacterium humireducens NBRC 106098 = DSM 45392 TaxID=1223515 RepID=A0A0B5DC66_9CORY|nr:ribonuclease D [Corynebacterium humireducens]AJE33354.1 ribonuclease D protein [Corynebacterium humireducens NBRC 106098 = DSM 45392]
MAPLISPRDGIPRVLSTPADFTAAAAALADGQGPVAIDTERASGFRYDDRAFLVQVRRRDVGTFLLDPEGHRPEFTAALAPALNGLDWIIHAAPSDLPSLAWLGLYPGTLFDTELAGRLAGFDHVNLAAMTEMLLDVHLAKGHGAEDWSQRPLPADWLAYAALDVELLLELGDTMAEILDHQGKLEWASQEFEHIRRTHATITGPTETTWRDVKGISTLGRPEQLAVARELWMTRESIAVAEDLAVGRVLPNKVLIEVARTLPRTGRDLARVKGFPARRRSAVSFWGEVVERALTSNPRTWPKRERPPRGLPSRQAWSNEYPDSYARYSAARDTIDELSAELEIPTENILRPATLREVAWAATNGREIRSPLELPDMLRAHDAREWQIDLTYPILQDALF